MLLANQYKYLGTELPNKRMDVLCVNNTTMNSTTTRQLSSSPALPPSAQKGNAYNDMDKTLVLLPVLRNAGCDVLFKEHIVQVTKN